MPRPKQWTEPEVAAACRYHIERMRRNFEHGDYTFTQGQATDHIALLESAPSVEAFVGWLNDNTSAKGRSNMHAALRMARKRSRDKAPKPEPSRQAKAAPTRPADDGAQLRADMYDVVSSFFGGRGMFQIAANLSSADKQKGVSHGAKWMIYAEDGVGIVTGSPKGGPKTLTYAFDVEAEEAWVLNIVHIGEDGQEHSQEYVRDDLDIIDWALSREVEERIAYAEGMRDQGGCPDWSAFLSWLPVINARA